MSSPAYDRAPESAAPMAARRLIVNADGFGFGAGATQGILDAIEGRGPITSVSVNANFPEAERVRELAAKHPEISVGVHLNPVAGRPCRPAAEIPSLVGPDGQLYGAGFSKRWRRGRIDERDLEAEFDAQISRVREAAAGCLTHLDSHQNSHLGYFGLFLRVARRWQIPFIRTSASVICLEAENPRRARLAAYASRPHVLAVHLFRRLQMAKARAVELRMADRLITVGYAGTGNKSVLENWERIFRNLPGGTSELYCHPAHADDVLRRWATYVAPRARELEILRRPHLRELARSLGIRLVSFLELRENA